MEEFSTLDVTDYQRRNELVEVEIQVEIVETSSFSLFFIIMIKKWFFLTSLKNRQEMVLRTVRLTD